MKVTELLKVCKQHVQKWGPFEECTLGQKLLVTSYCSFSSSWVTEPSFLVRYIPAQLKGDMTQLSLQLDVVMQLSAS